MFAPDTIVEMVGAKNSTKGGWGRVTNIAQNLHHISSALHKPQKYTASLYGACACAYHKAERSL